MDQKAKAKVAGGSDSSPTILVVEDDVLTRVAAGRYLRGCGFAVLEAVNVDEALALLNSRALDLVFADVKLPGTRNGADLVRIIQKEHPDVKMLMTSGFTSVPVMEGIDLLRKPYILRDVERRKIICGVGRHPTRQVLV